MHTSAFAQTDPPAPENAVLALDGCADNIVEFGFSEEFEFPEGTSGEVDLGFSVNFYGEIYDTIFVNENGNVTFDEPLGFYPFFDLPLDEIGTPIIAPFHANLTGFAQTAAVTYGAVEYAGQPAFCANWTDVSPDSNFFPQPTNARANVLQGGAPINTFQLLLVDRSDVAEGDFDLIFNYDRIDWDTSFGEFFGEDTVDTSTVGTSAVGTNVIDGEFGGEIPARAGYAADTPFVPNTSFELPSSGQLNSFNDGNIESGLIYNSLNSLVAGRYVFELRGGDAPAGQTISGEVTADVDGSELEGAIVQICLPEGQPCATTVTNPLGLYQLGAIPDGDYRVSVFPPGGSALLPSIDNPVTVEGQDQVLDAALIGPVPPPPGTGIEPSRDYGTTPTVYWNDALTITTSGCAGGAATFAVVQGASTFASGPMNEGPSGIYTATFGPLFPSHDEATVIMSIDCPDPEPDQETGFDIYIDPSGVISDVVTDLPVDGATAELYRSDSEIGPYVLVPDGDPIMSPTNRTNPFTTEADGRFGWDVVAGFYFVRASAPGCVDPVDATITFVDTDILPVEPEWLGLELLLACAPELTVPEALIVEATGPDGAVVDYSTSAIDAEDDNPAINCDLPSGNLFPLGETAVSCSATDAAGNESTGSFTISVTDTTPPALMVPLDITIEATDPLGNPVDFTVGATDLVDGDVPVACIPVSGSFFPVGITTILCTATDAANNEATGSFNVSVTDSTAPVLTLPDAMSVEASDPAGVSVTFTVTATDTLDANVTVDCIPASGSLFPVGVTTVNCTATDDAANATIGSFDVTVTFAATNAAPTITSQGSTTVVEGTTLVMAVEASDDTDSLGSGLIFSVGTEMDSALFGIDADTGALSFLMAPVFATPMDADGNNIYIVEVIVTDSGGLTDTQIINISVTAAPVAGELDTFYVSSFKWGEITQPGGSIAFTDEDILAFDLETETWSKAFDASDVGLTNNDVEAFHFLDEGNALPSILLAFTRDRDVPGVGEVEPTDIVKFIPTALGEETAGTFELYLKGDLVGLDRYREHIDAITMTPDGRLAVSTKASLRVNGPSGFLWGRSQDLIVINPDTTWELYFDGSTAELTTKRENIWASWIDADTGEIYFSTREHFKVGDVTGRGATVPICAPISLGQDNTVCEYTLFWSAVTHNFTRHNIDGMHIGPALPAMTSVAAASAVDIHAVDARAADLAAGDNEDDVELDELDSYLELPEEDVMLPELYLPLVGQ